MLSHKGFTFREPCPGRCSGHAGNGYDRGPHEARAFVSAGSDGVSGAGASSAAGGPSRPLGSGACPALGAFPARRIGDTGRRTTRRDAGSARLRTRHQRRGAHRAFGGPAAGAAGRGDRGDSGGDRPPGGGRCQRPGPRAPLRGRRVDRRPGPRPRRRPRRPLGLEPGGRRQAHLVRTGPARRGQEARPSAGAAAARWRTRDSRTKWCDGRAPGCASVRVPAKRDPHEENSPAG